MMRSLKIDEQRKNMMNINSFIDFFFFVISWNKKNIMKIQTNIFFIKMYDYNNCIFLNSLVIAPKEK